MDMVEKGKFLSFSSLKNLTKSKDKGLDKIDWKKSTSSLATSLIGRKSPKPFEKEPFSFTRVSRKQSQSYSAHPKGDKWTIHKTDINDNEKLLKTKSTDQLGLSGHKPFRTRFKSRELKISRKNKPITKSATTQPTLGPKFEKTTSEALFDNLLDTISLENIQELMKASPKNRDQLTNRSKSSSIDHANAFDLGQRLDWKGLNNLNKLIRHIETFQTTTEIAEWGQNEKLETKSKSDCFHQIQKFSFHDSSVKRSSNLLTPTTRDTDSKDSVEVTSLNSRDCQTTSDRFTASDMASDSLSDTQSSEIDLRPINLPSSSRKLSESSSEPDSGRFDGDSRKLTSKHKADKIIYETIARKLN